MEPIISLIAQANAYACLILLIGCGVLQAAPSGNSSALADSGSSVGTQPAPVPATSIPYLLAENEPQQRRLFPESSFAFGFKTADTSTPGGNLSGLFLNNDQALATLPNGGVGQNLVTLAPCAINQPHSHPRGTEISHITEGELFFGFIEENGNAAGTVGGRFINATLTKGQTIVVPQGLIHFAQNLQCQPAQFIASFPTSDPGTQTSITSLFTKLPEFVLRATIGLDDSIIEAITQKVASLSQANPSLDTTCLNQCGIPIPSEFYSNSPSGIAPSGY